MTEVEREMEGEFVLTPGDKDECQSNAPIVRVPTTKVKKKAIVALLILVYINLLNYMDRYTVSSVLSDIQTWFQISGKQAGLLQTVFVCSYMIFAPIFGYLGDRYSRKYVMAAGITVWSITTFAGSLMKRSQYYGFLALRGLVGIGEASYSTVAPTIIADLFVGDQRTKALTLFYFAIPCGSGLGYIAASKIAALMNKWQWALRVTPILGIIAVLLSLICVYEPERGAIECDPEEQCKPPITESRSYIDDVRYILKVRSFIWATLGFTCVAFAIGALSWWAPSFALYAEQVHDKNQRRKVSEVSYIFGIVTFVAGVVGVLVGAEWARRWRATNMKADAFVCGLGVMIAAPLMFLSLWTANKYIICSWVIMCIGEIFLFFSWTPNADILLYVIPPNCRSTAEAIQILILHIFGDAFSPFLIGAISDAYTGEHRDVEVMYLGLLYSLYMTLVVLCAGALCYFVNALYLSVDKDNVDALLRSSSDNMNITDDVELKNLPPSESDVYCSDVGGAVNDGYSNGDL